MSGSRVPFDLELPFVVAAGELVLGGRRFEQGQSFPWRDLSVSEIDLLQLWSFFKVDCVVAPEPSLPPVPATTSKPKRQRSHQRAE